MQPCDACAGNGIVPHFKRKMENGERDPSDFKVHDLCEKCGGSGQIPVDKAPIKEPGNVADMSGMVIMHEWPNGQENCIHCGLTQTQHTIQPHPCKARIP